MTGAPHLPNVSAVSCPGKNKLQRTHSRGGKKGWFLPESASSKERWSRGESEKRKSLVGAAKISYELAEWRKVR